MSWRLRGGTSWRLGKGQRWGPGAEVFGRPLTCCEFRRPKLVAGTIEWAILRAPDESGLNGGARKW